MGIKTKGQKKEPEKKPKKPMNKRKKENL